MLTVQRKQQYAVDAAFKLQAIDRSVPEGHGAAASQITDKE